MSLARPLVRSHLAFEFRKVIHICKNKTHTNAAKRANGMFSCEESEDSKEHCHSIWMVKDVSMCVCSGDDLVRSLSQSRTNSEITACMMLTKMSRMNFCSSRYSSNWLRIACVCVCVRLSSNVSSSVLRACQWPRLINAILWIPYHSEMCVCVFFATFFFHSICVWLVA